MRFRSLLRPLLPSDFEFCYLLAADPMGGVTWKFRGTTPSPDVFNRALYDGIFCQYIVLDAETLERVGFVALYNVSLGSRFGYVHALSVPGTAHGAATTHGALMLIDRAFGLWSLRKIYIETLETTAAMIGSALSRFAREEGRLRDHEILGGVPSDLVTFAVYADDWPSVRSRFIEIAAAP